MTKLWIAMAGFLLAALGSLGQASAPATFANFETAPVHPIDLSPDGARLAVCNLADGKLELFDVDGLVHLGSVPVGIDPVTVRFRTANEAWVVNHISDSVSVVDLGAMRVRATLHTLDTPQDLVFAGTRAFISCSLPNTIQVFDAETRVAITNLPLAAERPRALAVSPNGQQVYAAIFESGNRTTIVGGKFRNMAFFDNAASLTNGPYGGQNPPPNDGLTFQPLLNPGLTSAPPATGMIARKNEAGRWLDDNQGDWTEFVSGTNSALTQRVQGWDLPDRDVAVIDATTFEVTYATGLMNLCMALGVNPASGRVTVVGTDAINEVRFEPNLQGIFVRVKLASVNPADLSKSVLDINPHLDYSTPTIPQSLRDLSIGDPRAIVWTADGERAYVAGMGSRNVVQVDAQGARLAQPPIEVGDGPCGLALDETRQRLYVFNRFSSSLSVVDTATAAVIDARPLFDPTPLHVAAGRRHLYDTRRTSGLGQAACASCHVDARHDRLAWDLGNPAGNMDPLLVNESGFLLTNDYHPMKGVMVTQTLQDIIGHEPFHWRGDRPTIESFNGAFTNLQGAARSLTPQEMGEFREFLSSIRLPPNPFRLFDNSLSTNLPLPGHFASGSNSLPAGAPLPNGSAIAGLELFRKPASFCNSCHSLPTGLGLEFAGADLIPPGPNGEHHFPLTARLEGALVSKIPQLRNMADKVGMDTTRAQSQAGFGFGHDGSIDSLTRFLEGVRIVQDQDIADLIAFLFSLSGSDLVQPDAVPDSSPPAAVGRQLTLHSPAPPPLFDQMLALARAPNGRIELIAKGTQNGSSRGWVYSPSSDRFQSDRQTENLSPAQLSALAGAGTELTLTVVTAGSGTRLGIDRDLDGIYDADEIAAGTNPADPQLLPQILGVDGPVPLGTARVLGARVPPLIAPGTFAWWKDGQRLPGQTNTTLALNAISSADAGAYRFVVTTPFLSSTSPVTHLSVAPAVVRVLPAVQWVRQGSNAMLRAEVQGSGPFLYQWRFDGAALAGANQPDLIVTNAQPSNEGSYQLTAINRFGAVTSTPVSLGLLINPAVVVPPVSQRVLPGSDVTFAFVVSGHPPPFGFLLRRSSVVLTNYISDSPTGLLTLFNVQPADAGTYRIVITNAANPSPGLSLDPVTLTILDDSDNDGLPDEWEILHGLDSGWAGDALLDSDGDDQTNLQEYLAGTDPRDPGSLLRIERIFLPAGDQVAIEFNAAANQAYTLQFRDEPDAGSWASAAYVLPQASDRRVILTTPMGGESTRYFRLVPSYPPDALEAILAAKAARPLTK